MNTHTKLSRGIATTCALGMLLIGAASPTDSYADAWELRTTDAEVPGTREIESGKSTIGIQMSKQALPGVNVRDRVSVLNNLCIGFIYIQDLVQAERYCDMAAARPNRSDVSFNNRGVLNALKGEFFAARQDFVAAAIHAGSREHSHMAAQRNLDRLESLVPEIGAMAFAESSGKQTSQN